jgi:DNA-binding transcriptional ArsR family regulator
LNEQISEAMNHPIRFAALAILSARVASAVEIADELDQSPGAVADHLGALAEIGAIELVRTEERSGSSVSYYRSTVRPWFSEAEYRRLSPHQRRELFAPTIRAIIDDALHALANGGFDDPRAQVIPTTVEVDEQGYDELVALLRSTRERIVDIQAEAANRAAEAPEDRRQRAEVAMLHFDPEPPSVTGGHTA